MSAVVTIANISWTEEKLDRVALYFVLNRNEFSNAVGCLAEEKEYTGRFWRIS